MQDISFIWHTGSPKTGTSFLQRVFRANRDYLRDCGITYSPEGVPNHRLFFEQLRESRDVGATLDACLHSSGAGKQLVSYEGFANASASLLKSIARRVGKQSLVIQFVRSPASFAESAWKQWHMKSGRYRDFNHYLRTWKHPRWDRNLGIWQRYGARVQVLPYLPGKYDILDQFCGALGISNNFDIAIPEDDPWGANKSYNRFGTYLAQALEEPGDQMHNHNVQSFLNSFARDLCFRDSGLGMDLFDPATAGRYNRRHRKIIDKMERYASPGLYEALVEADIFASSAEECGTAPQFEQELVEVIRGLYRQYRESGGPGNHALHKR